MHHGQPFNGDTMEYDDLTIHDWRIIKEVNKRPISIQELQDNTKLNYQTVAYHCRKLYKKRLFERKKDACCIYFPTSSKQLWEEVMTRYNIIMEEINAD